MKTGGALTIEMKDGATYTSVVSKTLGNPENPMTEEQFRAKFFSCMDKAACPKTKEEQEAIFAHVKDLDMINEMRDIAAML